MHLERPCPMHISKLQKGDGTFHCSSCKNNVIDMRCKSRNEILAYKGQNFCGIFNSDQLPDQKPLSRFAQVLFSFITILSLIGFSVKPVKAQAPPPTTETEHQNLDTVNNIEVSKNQGHLKAESKEKGKMTRRERKNARLRKKGKQKKRVFIGCPSF